MNHDLERYWSLLDALRAQRRLPDWRAEHDRPLLERIDEIFATLDEAAENAARGGTWRGSPEQYDSRLERSLIEDVDPELGSAAPAPRRMAA
ncbi:MAG: hypothetical protein WCJ30_08405 [Deltaproteobacteria bacterium]